MSSQALVREKVDEETLLFAAVGVEGPEVVEEASSLLLSVVIDGVVEYSEGAGLGGRSSGKTRLAFVWCSSQGKMGGSFCTGAVVGTS